MSVWQRQLLISLIDLSGERATPPADLLPSHTWTGLPCGSLSTTKEEENTNTHTHTLHLTRKARGEAPIRWRTDGRRGGGGK